MLASAPDQDIRQDQRFMAESEDESLLRTFSLKKMPAILGNRDFIDKIKNNFFEKTSHIEVPDSKQLAPDMERIKQTLCDYYDICETDLYQSKRAVFNEPRAMGLYISRQLRGETLRDIGESYHIKSYSTVSTIIERLKIRFKKDRSLKSRYAQLKAHLINQEQT